MTVSQKTRKLYFGVIALMLILTALHWYYQKQMSEAAEGYDDLAWYTPRQSSWYFKDWFVVPIIIMIILAYPVFVVYSTLYGKPGPTNSQ